MMNQLKQFAKEVEELLISGELGTARVGFCLYPDDIRPVVEVVVRKKRGRWIVESCWSTLGSVPNSTLLDFTTAIMEANKAASFAEYLIETKAGG